MYECVCIGNDKLIQTIQNTFGDNYVDYDRIFTDKRGKSYQYFHIAKQTIAKHSYKHLSQIKEDVSIFITKL